MNDPLITIFNNIKTNALSDNERTVMRNELQAFMLEHPARAPFSVRVRDALSSYGSYFDTSSATLRLTPAVLALVFVVGIGTSYAAEGAMPGDILYPIKINVNETVRGSLAISQSAKADWNTRVMTRRLEEAETLAAEDRLTPVARAVIQTQLIESADRFDRSVNALARAEDGGTAAATAQSNLEATLDGHERVLTALAAVATSSESIRPILVAVRAQADETGVARRLIESHIASTKGEGMKAAALSKKSKAEGALQQVRTKVSASRRGEDSTSTKAASVSAFNAEQAITAGDENIKDGDYGQAFGTFQAAIRTAQSAEVHLDASRRLNADLNVDVSASSTATTIADDKDKEGDSDNN
ncbi:MAG: DUF5667 domain-containing protein [Candidatus Paceibacterota bacterium]